MVLRSQKKFENVENKLEALLIIGGAGTEEARGGEHQSISITKKHRFV